MVRMTLSTSHLGPADIRIRKFQGSTLANTGLAASILSVLNPPPHYLNIGEGN
jgi:hypothetical protein